MASIVMPDLHRIIGRGVALASIHFDPSTFDQVICFTFIDLLVKYTSPFDIRVQNAILGKLTTYCGKPVTNHTLDEFETPYQWTFYHSIFFAFTVCSTLGYGNIAPTSTLGRYFMIAYALVGMPLNGILYAYLGDYFGKRVT